jgi:hypothetical protein
MGPRDLDQNQRMVAGIPERSASLPRIRGEDAAEIRTRSRNDADDARGRRERTHQGGITYDKPEVMDGGRVRLRRLVPTRNARRRSRKKRKRRLRAPDEEFRSADPPKTCLKCGRPSTVEALWAKAY